ncbi:MAG: HAMP domain-containing histidine kinase [bacterium]|nr:HAMP domain-containing histidine kinase [bacterium]
MTLRSRLFLFFGGLIAALAGAEWWLVHSLTRDLETEVGQVALDVGSAVATLFTPAEPGLWSFGTRPDPPPITEHIRVQKKVLRHGDIERHSELHTGRHLEFRFMATGEVSGAGAWHNVEVETEAHAPLVIDQRAQIHGDSKGTIRILVDDGSGLSGVMRDIEFGHIEDIFAFAIPEALGPEALGKEEQELERATTPAPLARVPIPEEGFESAVDRFRSRLVLGSAAILMLALLVAGYAAHRAWVPLRGLAGAAREVEAGALGTQAPVGSDPEVHETIAAFNSMSSRLAVLAAEAEGLRRREHLTELGEVARGLAHSLRNPLNVLGLTVEELTAGGAQANDELATNARAQIRRIDRTLRTFLSLSSGGGEKVERVAVDEIARDVALELLQDTSRRVGVRVEVNAPSPELKVRAVGPELRAVLHVLMVNAVEASPTDGEVVCRLSHVADGVCVEVEDAGDGVSEMVRDRLFTPHTTTKEHGAGMGLYLAHRIATSRYSGALSLHERDPHGTRAVLLVSNRRTENGDANRG